MKNEQFEKAGEILFGYNAITPNGYDPAKKYPTIFFIHGIGECSNGLLAYLIKVYNWVFNNSFLIQNVDRYGFILIIPTYLNTTAEKSTVCKWILKRIKETYSVKEDSVTFVGHSNGSHTLGTWAFADADFASQVAVWVPSASGPFSTSSTFKNLAEKDVRIWGVTAVNDAVISTNYVQQLATKVPALNPAATVVITKFPATRFPNGKTAHNIVLGQITKAPLPFLSLGGITDRLGSTPKMDLYQFILSNPKGSIPQLPSLPYTGPKYAEQPEPIAEPPPIIVPPVIEPEPPIVIPPPPPPTMERIFKGYNIYGDNIRIEPVFSTEKLPVIKGEKGDEIKEMWVPASAIQKLTIKKKISGASKPVVK